MTLEEFENRYQFSTNEQSPDYKGSGAFGSVYRAIDTRRQRYVAIKESVVRPEFRQFSLQREVELSHEIPPHPNLLRYENNYRFQVGKLTVDYAVMPFYDLGNLEQFLRQYPNLPYTDRDNLIKGLLAGLLHLHNEQYIHRDLKAGNVLIDQQHHEYVPIIADFGLSRFVQSQNEQTQNSAVGFSPDYAAPEQFGETGRVSSAADIWAFGVLVYRILVGKLPFIASPNLDATQKRVDLLKIINQAELPNELATVAEPYQSVIRRCLIRDPEQRAPAPELADLLHLPADLRPAKTTRTEPVMPIIRAVPAGSSLSNGRATNGQVMSNGGIVRSENGIDQTEITPVSSAGGYVEPVSGAFAPGNSITDLPRPATPRWLWPMVVAAGLTIATGGAWWLMKPKPETGRESLKRAAFAQLRLPPLAQKQLRQQAGKAFTNGDYGQYATLMDSLAIGAGEPATHDEALKLLKNKARQWMQDDLSDPMVQTVARRIIGAGLQIAPADADLLAMQKKVQ